jgi:hypothetical protein
VHRGEIAGVARRIIPLGCDLISAQHLELAVGQTFVLMITHISAERERLEVAIAVVFT